MSTNAWKECMLGAYYGATLPARARAARERAKCRAEPVRIVFYHRVADEYSNEWTISTSRFAAQIRWLRARFDLVSLAEAQARIARGKNGVPTASITFDDGYADNMGYAVPLLLEHRIPFTYFVATNYVLGGEPFPHDVAAGRPLAPNTPDDICEMAAAGVELGGHTRGHVNLGSNLSEQQLVDEIAGCKRDLEALTKRPVRYFAFPYGQHANLCSEAFRIACEAGFDGVCSAYGGYNFPGDAPFHLRRIHADPESFRFKNWMTVDPRKLRMHQDFDPGDFRQLANKPTRQDKQTGRHGDKESSAAAPESPCLPISLSPCLNPASTAMTTFER